MKNTTNTGCVLNKYCSCAIILFIPLLSPGLNLISSSSGTIIISGSGPSELKLIFSQVLDPTQMVLLKSILDRFPGSSKVYITLPGSKGKQTVEISSLVNNNNNLLIKELKFKFSGLIVSK